MIKSRCLLCGTEWNAEISTCPQCQDKPWQQIFLDAGTKAGLGDLSAMIGVVSEIRQQGYEAGRAAERERIVGNVGVLRQLLNEERLPADKMIDNGYIERCLELSALSNDPTGEE